MTREDIDTIIEGCRKKEPKARKLLYEYYSGRMYAVCMRYSNSADDAQDILHEGFLKIFEKIDQYEGRGVFEGWIRRIIVNTALEKYRHQYKIIYIQDNLEIKEQYQQETLTESLTAKELMQFVQDLSPKYRMVFNLFAIEGYSHKEISIMLDISEGTSKSNLSRARSILQQKVKKYYHQSMREEKTI